jgi:DNA-binding transcriptional MerR regulator
MIRIGELSRQTLVHPQRLRAWELRYGLLTPKRTAGGLRLYENADVARVLAMQRLIEAGFAPAEAAERLLTEDASGSVPERDPTRATGAGRHAERLHQAVMNLDTTRIHRELDDAFAKLSVGATLELVVLPLLQQLGVSSSDELGVAREHLLTNALNGRLQALARTWDEGSGERILLACPPGEQHDLLLLMFGLALRERGSRIVYLGANTPIGSIRAALEQLVPSPASVVLSAMDATRFEAARESLTDLARVTQLWIAGRGATEAFASDVGAELLVGTPVQAARAHW